MINSFLENIVGRKYSSIQVAVSICIVNWNTEDLLRKCLQSVREFASDVGVEVLVVDNASSDGSLQMVETEFLEVRLWRNKENLGFARANNQLIKEAKGEFVLLLNSDAELLPGTLSGLVEFMRCHPRAAACSPKLINEDDRVQAQGQRFPSLYKMLKYCVRAHFPPFGTSMVSKASDTVRVPTGNSDVNIISGAVMLIRKEALDVVGLLNESLFFYGEEADLCFRFRQHGWQSWYVPEFCAKHLGGGSSRKNIELDTSWELTRGQISFLRNHRGLFMSITGVLLALSFYVWSLSANVFRLVILYPWRGRAIDEIGRYRRRIRMALTFLPTLILGLGK